MTERLYNLLPAIYRQRDFLLGEPLRALFAIMEQEFNVLEEDVAQLYDNLFVETSDEWVVPYIGDLLGIRGLGGETSSLFSQRTQVANTIAYRRAKGVAAILERVAQDVTGWPVGVVEYFQLLGTNQHLHLVQLNRGRTVDIRDRLALTKINTPFEKTANTIDVRPFVGNRGKHNIPNVGLFLWRLSSYPLEESTPYQVLPGCYTFNPLGHDMPLFNQPQPKNSLTQRTEPIHLPDAIDRPSFEDDLSTYQEAYQQAPSAPQPNHSTYYGPGYSLNVIKDGQAIPPEEVISQDLSLWTRPPAGSTQSCGWLSGNILRFPELTEEMLTLSLTIGDQGPCEVTLDSKPNNLEEARSALEKAIQEADCGSTFDNTQVFTINDDRLLVLAGPSEQSMLIESNCDEEEGSQTAQGPGLLSGDLSSFRGLTMERPALSVTIGAEGPHIGSLSRQPIDLQDAQMLLQAAIVGAHNSPTFRDAEVFLLGQQLFVLPGTPNQKVSFKAAPTDCMSVTELALDRAERELRAAFLLGNLLCFPELSAETPTLEVRLGEIQRTVTLQKPKQESEKSLEQANPLQESEESLEKANPVQESDEKLNTLEETRRSLEEAIRAADPASTFTNASVLEVDNRLLVLPGIPSDQVFISAEATDATLWELALDPQHLESDPDGGVLSGELPTFPKLTSQKPALEIKIGRQGPYTATFIRRPTDLRDTARLLEIAIQNAPDSDEPLSARVTFKNVQVTIKGRRLHIQARIRRKEITFSAPAPDETTASELALDSAHAWPVQGLLLNDFSSFPVWSSDNPAFTVKIADRGPYETMLSGKPSHLSELRLLLEAAIRRAHSNHTFTAARVVEVGQQLLVLPGTPGQTVTLGPSSNDPTTVIQLASSYKVAIDVSLGRLAFAVADEPKNSLALSYNYGFSADLGGGPYDRSSTLAEDREVGWYCEVSKKGQIKSLQQALAKWESARRPGLKGLIQIMDNQTYALSGLSTLEVGRQEQLIIQAANGKRPCLTERLTVLGSGPNARLTLNGLLLDGGVLIQLKAHSSLNFKVTHCTFMPLGIKLEGEHRTLQLTIKHSIVGALCLPANMASLVVQDSIIDASAPPRMALVSGELAESLLLSSTSPVINVTIGHEGPYQTGFRRVPKTLKQARRLLQQAIREAHTSRAFTEALVGIADQRLVVVPGQAGRIKIEANSFDQTAKELKLDPSSTQLLPVTVGGKVECTQTPSWRDCQVELTASRPQLGVKLGMAGPYAVTLGLGVDLTTLEEVRLVLQNGLREACPTPTPAFQQALVAEAEQRLLVVPGMAGQPMRFRATTNDYTTISQLKLQPTPSQSKFAIAYDCDNDCDNDCDDQEWDRVGYGPSTTLERVTLFGQVKVKELALASEVIFTEKVDVQRTQVGGIRFSYVPHDAKNESKTPPHYRCQPDMAIEQNQEQSEEQIVNRLQPSFSSVKYNDPGYAQLSRQCPPEITGGAENGAEMGAFQHLLQPQRQASLEASLDEYLPIGLQPGFFYVT